MTHSSTGRPPRGLHPPRGPPAAAEVTDSLNEKLSRVARYDGGDAAARFAAEK
jgi:hypothetical protein